MENYDDLLVNLLSLKEDFIKFYKNGNKAAGTRVRQGLFEVIQKASDTRKEISKIKNGK